MRWGHKSVSKKRRHTFQSVTHRIREETAGKEGDPITKKLRKGAGRSLAICGGCWSRSYRRRGRESLQGIGEADSSVRRVAARAYAETAAERRHAGGPIGEADCQIAATSGTPDSARHVMNARRNANAVVRVGIFQCGVVWQGRSSVVSCGKDDPLACLGIPAT